MLSDTYFATLLRDLRAHRDDVDQMINFAAKLAGTTITPPSARPAQTDARGPAGIHAAARLARTGPRSTVDAIRQVLTARGPLRQREVVAQLRASGWTAPRGTTNVDSNIGATLSQLVKRGALRRVGNNGTSVYALAEAPAHATRKLADAVARLDATPARPTTTPPTRTRIVPDVPLADSVKGELANATDALTAPELADRLIAGGLRIGSARPADVVQRALRGLEADGVVVVDRSQPRAHRYRLDASPDHSATPE